MRERALAISALLPMVWLGFVLAISFMETPLKFRALTRVEFAFVAVLAIAGVLSRWQMSAQVWPGLSWSLVRSLGAVSAGGLA